MTTSNAEADSLNAGVATFLAHCCTFGYHSRAMLSRAQEARVRDILGNHPPGIIQRYCLEHLAAAVRIPRGHLADLAAFVRSLREHGADSDGAC